MIVGSRQPPPGVSDNGRLAEAAQFSEHVFENVGWRMAGINKEFGNPFVRVIEK